MRVVTGAEIIYSFNSLTIQRLMILQISTNIMQIKSFISQNYTKIVVPDVY